MPRTRVLVAEDSLTVRRRLCDVIGTDPELELVGEAEDGRRAIELCQALRPDVVTLDMMMPVMSGLATTEYIMAYCPTPILVVSSSVNRGELYRTYDALAAGAVDLLEKPRGDEPEGTWERKFIAAVKLVAKIRVITHPRGRLRPRIERVEHPPRGIVPDSRVEVIAVGASTGGPSAIVEILHAIPTGRGVPILLVLHINEPFGGAFADWLDGQTQHRVRFAVDGETLGAAADHVVMAPPGRHLAVTGRRLRLTRDAERHSCRPSIDVLFESLALARGARAAGVLLTGMGRDGAAGLLAMRDAGAPTIAQDEASCVVFGMPREAIQLGAVARILPLGEIGPALAELVERVRGGRGK